jgi:hypothetical protein
MSRETGALSLYLQPLRTAANFGASLGEKFRNIIDSNIRENHLQERQTNLIDNSKHELRLLFADNSSQYNALTNEQKNALEEMIQMRIQDQEDERKHREEIAKQELIYQATSATALESAYKATTPDEKDDPVAYAKHIAEMEAAVADAVRSEAKMMTTNELKDFASRYGGLNVLVDDREFAIRRLGLSSVEAQDLSGSDIAKLQHEKDIKYLSVDTESIATKIDKLSNHDYQGLVKEVNRLHNNLLKVSKKTDFGIVDLDYVRDKDKERVRNLLDWFESLEIA